MKKTTTALISAGLVAAGTIAIPAVTAASSRPVHPTCYDRAGRYTPKLQPTYCGLTTYDGGNLPTLVLTNMQWTGKRKGVATVGFTNAATGRVTRRVDNAKFRFHRPLYVNYVMGTGKPGWQYSRFTTQGKTYITIRKP